jgi:uncharacterized short protein YbdD (DUF466 family)
MGSYQIDLDGQYIHRKIKNQGRKMAGLPPLGDLVVHHKNRNPSDNRRTNLQTMTKEAHHDFHRKSKAHSTFMKKFKESNPNSSWKTASYKWKKFKEKHSI